MERTGGDHDAGDAQDTGAVFCTWNSSQLFYRILYDGSSFGGKLTFSFESVSRRRSDEEHPEGEEQEERGDRDQEGGEGDGEEVIKS